MENFGDSAFSQERTTMMEPDSPSRSQTSPPLLPRKSDLQREEDRKNYRRKIRIIIDSLCYYWGLDLPELSEHESPAKQTRNIQYEIVSKIKFLCAKDEIDPLVDQFETQALSLYSDWVQKPKADRGVRGVPEKTRQCKRTLSDEERDILLNKLLATLTVRFDAIKTPSKPRLGIWNPDATLGPQNHGYIDSSPIPFPLSTSKNETKRPLEPFSDQDGAFKKPRRPVQVPNPPRNAARSAQTSFASTSSSVFSNPRRNTSNQSLPGVFTQETIPTQSSSPSEPDFDAQTYREQANTSFRSNTQSSEYEGASSPDADLVSQIDSRLVGISESDPIIDDELSQDLVDQAAIVDTGVEELIIGEDELRQGLKGIFPSLPRSLWGIPFRATYEIVRVFLQMGLPVENAPAPSAFEWSNYDELWQWLKGQSCLKGKKFPRKSSQDAWNAAGEEGFLQGTRATYMSGSLRFNTSEDRGPFFRLLLNPLKLNKSNRTGRRFGHDRLFDFDIPSLTGRYIPKLLKQMGPPGSQIIIEWLVDQTHHFLERIWKPFHLKGVDRKDRKPEVALPQSDDAPPSHRIFFFAVDGLGFNEGSLPVEPLIKPYVRLSVDGLLNSIRPTRKNGHQSYLKLFARTSLALSRNVATIILEKSQIRYREDINNRGEDMTDGAGRMSLSLALRIVEKLGLTYRPSGFQARIGSAKGFWSVCPTETSSEDWLEIYESQCKWKPSSRVDGESDHPSHRTFEVLEYSKPLRSADLNLQFVPLLIDRADSPMAMRKALGRLLEDGLSHEMETLQTEMEAPQSFRKWVRETHPTTQERLRNGGVSFEAGLPTSIEERLNVLLDAGFNPKELRFLKELTKTVFNNRCKDLQEKLKITIGKSAHAYMIPDFAGVLEEGEVYLDFSSFIDEMSGFSGDILNGVDILVARSPAHFVSDIQKVRAVYKVELMGLKDVIVFSTKGKSSLAATLSGGDFDGDIAWVCWEKSIVNNFTNAKKPQCPKLVEEGYLRKDATTYDELVKGQPDPQSTFLKRAFAFNMQPDLLGICTVYKERVCYDLGRVDTEEALYLSTLLSDLVDASKQGSIFTEEDWSRFKAEKVKILPRWQDPDNKNDNLGPNAKNILDYLKWVAKKTVDTALKNFSDGFPDPPQWDNDLAAYYEKVQNLAICEPLWKKILDDLEVDMKPLKEAWNARNSLSKESRPPWGSYIIQAYEEFQAISPHEMTIASQTHLLDSQSDPELSSWALLKASALFASYNKHYVSNFVWHIAGKQLCHLKAKATGGMFAVVPSMYSMLKSDPQYVKALLSEEPLISFGEDAGAVVDDDDEMIDE